jgi:nitroreductase
MMRLTEAIESRNSVRNFLPDPVPVEDLKELARLASLAPSVNNYQPWEYIAVTNRELLTSMADLVRTRIQSIPENDSKHSATIKRQVEFFATFFEQAPALIALTMEDYETILEKGVNLSHKEINEIRNYPDMQSAGASVQNLLLAAVSMGYGACWMSAPMVARAELESMLEVKSGRRLICFVALGKPATSPTQREKKPVDELFRLIE